MRYIGSKTKLIPEIENVISKYNIKGTLLDAFAGSGAVSTAFKNKFTVISCDILKVCYTVTKCSLIDHCSLTFTGLNCYTWLYSDKPIQSVFDFLNSIPGKTGYVTESFTPL